MPRSKFASVSGGRASRDKGNRLERSVVKLLQDNGIGAERVPLSGSAGGSYSGDISVPCLGRDLVSKPRQEVTVSSNSIDGSTAATH
jgi:hypothetical protein